MKILAVDTTTNVLSVAVTDNGKVLSEYSIDHGRTHSQKLMPVILAVMENIGLEPSDIDAFAAANGPGSFTGIRIGLTAIRTMAQVTGKPVITVSTLLGLSYNAAFTKGRVCAVLDARNNNVYCGIYSFRGKKHKEILEPCFMNKDELSDYLESLPGKTYVVGDCDLIDFKGKAVPGEKFNKVSASSVAMAANEGKVLNYNEADAAYINKPQAERELEEREKNK